VPIRPSHSLYDDPKLGRNRGAIGHPRGMSGARITGSVMLDLKASKKSLFMMYIGVGQGIAVALEAL
jgi:acetyl-CoA acyltransferase